MRAAFEEMDLNPDYMSTHEEQIKKSEPNIEGGSTNQKTCRS